MTFLQKLAGAMAHEQKPVQWTTPVGVPWRNGYYNKEVKHVQLWLHDKGVKVSYDMDVAVADKQTLDKKDCKDGIAPNFVHACDAAHLMLTVNAAHKEGINHFALVHDSFGCLASQSTKMHRIIREQFVQMYEQHDVLSEVLEQSKCALIDPNCERLPDVVQYGSLNIKDVLNAQYAFA
jgi:DNA-directed RNA polymerase